MTRKETCEKFGIPSQKGNNPKIYAHIKSNGDATLNLEFTLPGGKLIRQSLHMTLHGGKLNPLQRQENKDTLIIAEKIRREHEKRIIQGEHGVTIERDNASANVLDYMQQYVDDYKKPSYKVMRMALQNFKTYLDKYHRGVHGVLRPAELNTHLMKGYADYLEREHKGHGAHTCFARTRTILLALKSQGIIKNNPCDGITVRNSENEITKETLSEQEIEQLLNNPHPSLNPEIQRAFICSLYTGMRFCDVKALTYGNIKNNGERYYIQFCQAKTGKQTTIPLHESLVGDVIGYGEGGEKVFKLGTHEGCLKALQHWASHAGINKHITWHCARHSAAMNLLFNGYDVKTVSSILGHSSIRMTEKYLHAVDTIKRAAVDSLRPAVFVKTTGNNK